MMSETMVIWHTLAILGLCVGGLGIALAIWNTNNNEEFEGYRSGIYGEGKEW